MVIYLLVGMVVFLAHWANQGKPPYWLAALFLVLIIWPMVILEWCIRIYEEGKNKL